MNDKVFIGLTGSFGSGCGTLRRVLQEKSNFVSFKLSEVVREEAAKRGYGENRHDLQEVGNLLRKENGNNYLALRALEKASETEADRIVFHGIRNIGEVREFKRRHNFYLVAVDCSKGTRWERLSEQYNNDRTTFELDDKRDKDQGLSYGQQVLACVEEADVLFINNKDYPTPVKRLEALHSRFSTHLGLITGEKLRNPSKEETMMTVASTLALQSHCIKRRVGAVLCDSTGYILSAAYNEVPSGQSKCIEEYGMCYRDHVRNEFKKDFLSNLGFCPECKKEIGIVGNDFRCEHCSKELSSIIPKYKALDKCRSLHAEETTILKAPSYHAGTSTMYTTTFPCLQCAKRILHSGIKEIVYIDPYPEEEAITMLETGDVRTSKFQGVKAQAYYNLFFPHQEFLEREIKGKVSAV